MQNTLDNLYNDTSDQEPEKSDRQETDLEGGVEEEFEEVKKPSSWELEEMELDRRKESLAAKKMKKTNTKKMMLHKKQTMQVFSTSKYVRYYSTCKIYLRGISEYKDYLVCCRLSNKE